MTSDALGLSDGVNVADVIGLGVLSGDTHAPNATERRQGWQNSLGTFPCHKFSLHGFKNKL